MVTVTYISPHQPMPAERHVVVVVHRERVGSDKGYFYDSAEADHGGSGPFDFLMNEAIERAQKFARDRNIGIVAVRAEAVPA